MRSPNIYWINELNKHYVQQSHPTLGWVHARPLGFYGLNLKWRLRAAWLVFTGKADVVRWFE